eukprot:14040833-Ditylum_brightwellii.AAC.1
MEEKGGGSPEVRSTSGHDTALILHWCCYLLQKHLATTVTHIGSPDRFNRQGKVSVDPAPPISL